MSWEAFRPSRATATCLVLLSFSFLLMTFRLTKSVQIFRSFLFYWISPSQETATATIQLGKDLGSRLIELVRAHHENTIFKEKMKSLSFLEGQYQETLMENQRLKEMLNLKPSMPFEVIPAMVSGRDTQNWMSVIWINRGYRDGILPDSPVLAVEERDREDPSILGGVAGRVLECGPNTSRVLLISDPLSSIAVSLSRTGEQGLVTGKGSSSITIEYLESGADIKLGDEVVTSGLGGIFPAGLSIGKLINLVTSPLGFKRGEVKTIVPLSRLKEVLVLKKR